MNRRLMLDSLLADLAANTSLLDDAVEVGDKVGIRQFESRIINLRHEIDAIQGSISSHANLAVFFGGAPVLGSQGIAADFAGKVLEQLQTLISTAFAESVQGALGEKGPLPYQDTSKLMVTGVVHGSFGFTMDEMVGHSELFETQLCESVSEVARVIDAAGSTSDTRFLEVADNLDQRMLLALRNFFKSLDSNSATIRLVEDLEEYSLDEVAVQRARRRTEETEIVDQEEVITGVLRGFLPDHKRFELMLATDEVISGTASDNATEQYLASLVTETPLTGKECSILVRLRTVTPFKRPARTSYHAIDFTHIGQSA